ncbi:unnamed protein product, partial [Owenia fusiformis]
MGHFKCRFCTKLYTKKKNRDRHEHVEHRKRRVVCSKCCKEFTRNYNLKCHLEKCNISTSLQTSSSTSECNDVSAEQFITLDPSPCDDNDCLTVNDFEKCEEIAADLLINPPDEQTLQNDVDMILDQAGYGDNDADNFNQQPYINPDGSVDVQLRDIYEANEHIIYAPHRRGVVSHEYNFHIPSGRIEMRDMENQLEEIYLNE